MAFPHCNEGSSQCGYLQQCLASTDNMTQFDCIHDPIFPLTVYTLIVYILTPFYEGLALMGGFGCNINIIKSIIALVLVGPLLQLQLNYYQYQATEIAYALTIGGCFANSVVLMFEKNPEYKQRPMINFEIALIFSCGITIGTNIGTFSQTYVPLIAVLVIEQLFLLSVLSYLVLKWLKVKNIETKKEKVFSENYVDHYSQLRFVESAIAYMDQIDAQSLNSRRVEPPNNEKVNLFNFYENKQNSIFPKKLLGIMLGFIFITQLSLRLPWFYDSRCQKLEKFFITALINIAMTTGVYFLGRYEEVKKNSCLFQMDERYYNPKSFALLYTSGLTSGFVAGFIGYGAGLVAVPAMLYMNVSPRVATATSAFISFGISFNGAIALVERGGIDCLTVCFFLSLSLIGGSIVTKIGYKLMDKYQMSHVVILIVIMFGILSIISGDLYSYLLSQRFGFDYLQDTTRQKVDC